MNRKRRARPDIGGARDNPGIVNLDSDYKERNRR